MNVRILALLLASATPSAAQAAPQTGRVWLYGSGTAQLSPSWSVSLIPGTRYEYARSGEASSKGHYLDELFVGPNWSMRSGNVGVKVSLWYYFLGYPRDGSYPLSHNLELVPSVEYSAGTLSLSYRAIFHNTVYASVYPTAQRWGWGTVMRNLFQAKVRVLDDLALLAADEPWFGLIENHDTPYSPAGYWQSGFRLNRLYAGFDWKAPAGVTISPQYVFETAYDGDGKVSEMGHYLFLTVGYVLKAY